MDMDQLLDAFERGTLEGSAFPHEAHLRVAWLLNRKYGWEQGLDRLIAGIRGVAERAGSPDAFHETITRAWFVLATAADDLRAFPELFDRSLLERYYSRDVLESGRSRWVEPDLHPLQLPAPRAPDIDFLGAMRKAPAAVAVVGAHSDGAVHAATVSSATAVSRQPPLLLVCLDNGSRVLVLVREAQAFALSFLASDQEHVAERFADPERAVGREQFAGIGHGLTAFGPVLDHAAAALGCTLFAEHDGGDHRIVIGKVGAARAAAKRPLVRHDGAFH
jgi:flavin reductase (DIM6/NTAB) family NADH-FMN oxidoreductase RutF